VGPQQQLHGFPKLGSIDEPWGGTDFSEPPVMLRLKLGCPAAPGVLPVPEGHGTVGTGCSLLRQSPTAQKEGRSLSSLGACAYRVASGNTGRGRRRRERV
jgi:hypothetical protein